MKAFVAMAVLFLTVAASASSTSAYLLYEGTVNAGWGGFTGKSLIYAIPVAIKDDGLLSLRSENPELAVGGQKLPFIVSADYHHSGETLFQIEMPYSGFKRWGWDLYTREYRWLTDYYSYRQSLMSHSFSDLTFETGFRYDITDRLRSNECEFHFSLGPDYSMYTFSAYPDGRFYLTQGYEQFSNVPGPAAALPFLLTAIMNGIRKRKRSR